MPKIQDLTGKTFGIWKVTKKTTKRSENGGSIVYECLNLKNNKLYLKDTGYLYQFKNRKSKTTTLRGRPRKWIIVKKPYVE